MHKEIVIPVIITDGGKAYMNLEDGFLNAYTFGFCEKKGFTRGTAWRWSLRQLACTTGCNAIILPV
jgi:hypothetical protein